MVFRFFWGKGDAHLESVQAKVQEMLRHARHEFDLAMSALLGDVVAREVNDELRSTDRKVNELEREIRRELVVHASVVGGIDSPAVLIHMSVVKDIERIGDYAKNLLDLALDGANFSRLGDEEEWRRLSAEISQYIPAAGEAFIAQDSPRCLAILQQGDALLDRFDSLVSGLVREENSGAQAVARALAYRYLKRVVAHLMNFVSAVVMPIDRLDYFTLDPKDRSSR